MLLDYSLKHKLEYCIPPLVENPHSPNQVQFFSQNLNYCDVPNRLPIYPEDGFTYNEIPYIDNVCFKGYWQSWKYIQDYRAQILTILNIPKAIAYGRIFLHYRLGDYKHLDKFHKIISDDYIEKALQLFYDKGYRDIMVFSDEIKMLLPPHSLLLLDSRFKWHLSEGRTPLQDLSLMAACSGGIMSASAFSWFGAWLGNSGRMITYPKNWFGEELKHDTKDLCPPEWVSL